MRGLKFKYQLKGHLKMISLLITDDEKLIRQGIKKIVIEAFGDRLKVFDAKNGKEALDFVLKEKPQIILTDIRMPALDGIELMQTLRSIENAPEIIVLSGYDNFSYAKEAIESGAVSYLLKPVDKNELIQTISKVMQKVEQKSQADVCSMLRDILDNGKLENALPLKGDFTASGFFCLAIHTGRFESFMREMNISDYYVFEQKRYITLALISFYDGKKIKDKIKDLVDIKVALSLLATNLSSLRIIRDQALSAFIKFYVYTDKTGCVVYETENIVHNFSAVDAVFEKLVCSIQNGKLDLICDTVSELCDISNIEEKKQGTIFFYVYQLVVQNLPKRFSGYSESDSYLAMKRIMIEQIWNCASVTVWKQYLLDYAVYISAILKQATVEFPFIEEALEYIKEHYSENINMAMVSNAVSINYTYFSEKFKEHTGKNFNEYMKEFRIQKAKELLAMERYKVYEVAAKTGFTDVKYFIKIFKEITGTTPSKYQIPKC